MGVTCLSYETKFCMHVYHHISKIYNDHIGQDSLISKRIEYDYPILLIMINHEYQQNCDCPMLV